MSQPLHFQTARELAGRLRAREISAAELLEQAIARIEALDGRLNAVVARDFERARAHAQAADAELDAGGSEGRPLLGLPVTIKDALETEGLVTACGAPELAALQELATFRDGVEGSLRAMLSTPVREEALRGVLLRVSHAGGDDLGFPAVLRAAMDAAARAEEALARLYPPAPDAPYWFYNTARKCLDDPWTRVEDATLIPHSSVPNPAGVRYQLSWGGGEYQYNDTDSGNMYKTPNATYESLTDGRGAWGDDEPMWGSGDTGDAAWLQADFGEIVTVNEVSLFLFSYGAISLTMCFFTDTSSRRR